MDNDKMLCRTCLQTQEKYHNIFEHSEEDKSISTLLFESTSIQVQANDGYPQNICNSCLNKLNSAYAFKAMVIDSDIKLRQLSNEEINCDATVKVEFVTDSDADEDDDVCDDSKQIPLANVDRVSCDESVEDFEGKLENTEVTKNEIDIKNYSDESNHEDNSALTENAEIEVNTNDKDEVIDPDNKHVYLTKKERNSKAVYCKECKRTFGYRYYFEIHARNHIGDTPFKCDVCGKGFVRRFQLNVHKVKHSNDRPFSCEVCGKNFKTNTSLQNHKIVHTDDKPFACKKCDKTFRNMNNLKAHELRHDNNKRFVCEICGKGFVDQRGFISHTATHKAEADIACPQCGKMFRDKLRMQDHLRLSHSSRKPYICSYCGRGFSRKPVLQSHVRIHTGSNNF
ncbi:Zinc-finger associated domain (zf-AD) [Popillia japonica]|uniref:Zinc-finger associated domain (Zf-AD) n=1 Tax=Popillia japonica TaxID=7064 RepID=A0AAW1KL77_POPJA